MQSLYQNWVLDACRNILAILEDMPSLRPPIDHLCELLPRLQARYYSIASSSKVTFLNARELKVPFFVFFLVRYPDYHFAPSRRFTPTASIFVQ